MSKRTPKNHNLIRKIKEARKAEFADSVLKTNSAVFKRTASDSIKSIFDAIYRNVPNFRPLYGCLGARIYDFVKSHPQCTSQFHKILTFCAKHTSLIEDYKNVDTLFWLAYWYDFRVRDIEAWKCRSNSARRQLSELIRHLYAKYHTPAFMEAAFTQSGNNGMSFIEQEWYIHVGGGQNIRTAAKLPFPLTKMMAHFAMQAPPDLNIKQALRYGQVLAMKGSERMAKALAVSRLSRENLGHEDFWITVVNLFIQHQDMMDVSQIDPVLDYIHNQRFVPAQNINGVLRPPQPNMTMKGRTPETLIAQTEAWHRQISRSKINGVPIWNSCGINGFHKTEGEGPHAKHYSIVELTKAVDLKAEGSAMSHCVGSYAGSCSAGRTAIYSLRYVEGVDTFRVVTIEVTVNSRMIVQVRGKRNAKPNGVAARFIRAWAQKEKLQIAGHALTAGW